MRSLITEMSVTSFPYISSFAEQRRTKLYPKKNAAMKNRTAHLLCNLSVMLIAVGRVQKQEKTLNELRIDESQQRDQ